jgi:phosphatidylinositol glycan class T
LTNSLSGLFCASLSRMDDRRTTSPIHTFTPGPLPLLHLNTTASSTSSSSGPSSPRAHPKYHLRHATLPSENVCTENLTPFIKLLPCSGKSGLSELLAPHRLFDADWHSLAVHVGWSPENGGEVRLNLGFNAVFNPVRTNPDGRRGRSRLFSSQQGKPLIRFRTRLVAFLVVFEVYHTSVPSCEVFESEGATSAA